MKLITELNEDVEYLIEGTDVKRHYIHGPFLVAATVNGNGRIYPQGIMEKEVERYRKHVIAESRAYGELNHPPGPTINLDRVSHLIKELKQDGKTFIGKAELTETPMGLIAIGLMKSGAKLGVSSRALGTLKPLSNGVMEVQSDFKLSTAADIVANPSAPGAFVNGIMENVDWIYDAVSGTYMEQHLDQTRKALHKLTPRQIEENTVHIFKSFLADLSKV